MAFYAAVAFNRWASVFRGERYSPWVEEARYAYQLKRRSLHRSCVDPRLVTLPFITPDFAFTTASTTGSVASFFIVVRIVFVPFVAVLTMRPGLPIDKTTPDIIRYRNRLQVEWIHANPVLA